jgi:ATP-dependent helicase/DNAse subunit B
MPLELVTGPANAAKAGVVLGAVARLAAAGREPLLVVPTFPDVARYRRELAERGVVLGVEVLRFGRLVDEIARRAGVRPRTASRVARERLVRAAVAETQPEALARTAATAGFPAAFLRLVSDLEQARIEPPRLRAALALWTQDADPRRQAEAAELGALYAAYRRGLERLGRTDPDLRTTAVLDALRLAPGRWGTTPVLLYGFDDLTAPQLDAIDALANVAGADVTFALTFEAGRAATAARARTHADLLALGARERALDPDDAHYADAARPVLHHLERGLLEPDAGRVAPAGAVRALVGGGERAEAEIVARHVATLVSREGLAPEEVAIVHRGLRQAAPLLHGVLRAAGVPAALEVEVPAGSTALGRGVVAILRCATDAEARADELLAWLRTPGLLERPALADALEQACRTGGLRSAAAARARWEREHWPLDALDRVAEAAASGPAALADRLAAEALALLARPFDRQARILDADEGADARVAARLAEALREWGGLPGWLAGGEGWTAELARTLAELPVRLGEPPGPGRVTVTTPMALRAHRVRALVLMGLQEGTFPAPRTPEPLLGDADRAQLNAVAGLRLPLPGDRLAAERHLLYLMVSRPTDHLVLAWHEADDDGGPRTRSPFVDDVADLLGPQLLADAERRPLGATGWTSRAPTPRDAERAAVAAAAPRPEEPIAPLRAPWVLERLASRPTVSASALEAWTACPVRWFVERHLRPQGLVPDPEPLLRGQVAHAVLEDTLRAVDGPLEPARLPAARALLHEALAEHARRVAISVVPERLAAEVRRLEVDLTAYLEHAFRRGSQFTPAHFELSFGGPDDALGPLELFDGELRIAGTVDRVDLGPGGTTAVVFDYKGRTAPRPDRWLPDGRLQMALYVLAVQQLLGLDVVGGLYQPVNAREPLARGVLVDGADPDVPTKGGDRRPAEELEALVAACASAARDAAGELRAGRLRPRPASCGWNGGGCAHPSICRVEAGAS